MILLSISLAIVTKKLLNVSAIILGLDSLLLFITYGFDLFMRVCLKADNRSNSSPDFFRVVFVFFRIALVVTRLINSCEFVNCVFVNFKVL